MVILVIENAYVLLDVQRKAYSCNEEHVMFSWKLSDVSVISNGSVWSIFLTLSLSKIANCFYILLGSQLNCSISHVILISVDADDIYYSCLPKYMTMRASDSGVEHLYK